MSRKNTSLLWEYFEKIDDKKATCTLCDEDYSFQTTTANLSCHLRRKHPQAYVVFAKAQAEARLVENESDDGKEKVVYLVAESPASPITKRTESKDSDTHSGHRRSSFLKRKIDSRNTRGMKEKSLIQQLTNEKIAVTAVQKELVEKELEEKTMKVLLLQEEMEHRKYMYELEKEEMQLKIEILKANLAKQTMGSDTMPSELDINSVPAE